MTKLQEEYNTLLSDLGELRKKAENLSLTGNLDFSEVEKIYGMIFVEAFKCFESLLENLFWALLTGRVNPNSVKLKYKPRQITPVRHLLFTNTDGDYLDWMPYPKTIERAKRVLEDGKPFTNIDEGLRSQLQEMYFIRNAVCHSSESSLSTFKDKVIGQKNLKQNEKTPLGFLRSQLRVNPPKTRLENYIEILFTAAAKLKN